jgi:hypothetical protein
MLPLEGIFLLPSLIVVPVAFAVLIAMRERPAYPKFWTCAAVTCCVLSAFFAIHVLKAPLYSERIHQANDPAGPPGLLVTLAVLLLGPWAMVPAFGILILLACLPPIGLPRLRLLTAAVFYVGILTTLMMIKSSAYMADYRMEKSKPQQTPFERFKHLREKADAASDPATK